MALNLLAAPHGGGDNEVISGASRCVGVRGVGEISSPEIERFGDGLKGLFGGMGDYRG